MRIENGEAFWTGSAFFTFELIEIKYITKATIPGCSIYSLFKQVKDILQVYPISSGWHKLEPWTGYHFLPFRNCIFSTGRMNYLLDYMSEMYKDAWNIFQKRDMLFIHLTVDCVLAKINEIRYWKTDKCYCYWSKWTVNLK